MAIEFAAGQISNTPALATDLVRVSVPNVTQLDRVVFGPVKWRANNSINGSLIWPAKGDPAIVATDLLTGAEWLVSWTSVTDTVPAPTPPPIAWMPGDVKMTAKSSPDTGWLLCDGAAVLKATYPVLFAALGGESSPWGVPDVSNFWLPDLRGRAPVGAGQGPGLANHNLATIFGTEGEILALSQMPTHNHGGATGNDSPDHTHGTGDGTHPNFLVDGGGGSAFNAGGNYNIRANTGGVNNTHTHSIANAGSSASHNNLPPSVTVNYVIKT